MKRSKKLNYFLGILAIVIGIGILFNSLGIMNFNISHLFPFIILFFGKKLLDKGRKVIGTLIIVWAALLFINIWFGIRVGDFIGLLFSFCVIYIGYRMMRSKKKEIQVETSIPPSKEEKTTEHPPRHEQPNFSSGASYSVNTPEMRHSLIGNMFLTGSRWELRDMNIWHGIGEVKIDLSRAFIHEGETVIVVSGWIGDIDIYVPYDLELSLMANINIGDIDVFGNKQGGFNRSMNVTTSHYRDSSRKVRMIVSLLIGDIDIKYV